MEENDLGAIDKEFAWGITASDRERLLRPEKGSLLIGRPPHGGIIPSAGSVDNHCMLALSIRQPYAELILRGIKTVELRSRATTIIGEHFYL